jgi:hypothetical protein
MVMIAARGNERGLLAVALGQFETEHPAIKAKRPFEIGDLQVDMADANSGIEAHGSQPTSGYRRNPERSASNTAKFLFGKSFSPAVTGRSASARRSLGLAGKYG